MACRPRLPKLILYNLRLLGAVIGLLALLSTLSIGTASADTSCASAFGSFSASNVPQGCWRPYGPDSPFNRQLPANPIVAPQSASMISDLAANHIHFEGGGSQFAFTNDAGRDGVYYAQNSDPLVAIHCTYEWGPGTCTGDNHVNVDGQQIHIPAGAQPQNNGSDMHMTIIDQATQVEYDFEHATWSADHNTLNVWSGAEIASGPNIGTGLGAGGTAAGTSTLAGLITAPELAAGAINHALAISIPCTDGSVYPAGGANGFPCNQIQPTETAGTKVPLGSLLQLNLSDAQIAASGAPAWEQTLMTAMAHYGLYVNDTNGSGFADTISLEAVSDISYTSLGGQPLLANLIKSLGGGYYAPLSRWILSGPALDITKFRVLNPCVAQNTCPTNTTGTPTGTSTLAQHSGYHPVARISVSASGRTRARLRWTHRRLHRQHGPAASRRRAHKRARRAGARCLNRTAPLLRGAHRRRTGRMSCVAIRRAGRHHRFQPGPPEPIAHLERNSSARASSRPA